MKRHLLFTLFCIIALMLPAQTISSPYYFRSFDSDNGLSNNSVNVVIQGKSGLMYFGTKDGLNLYNGISSRTFRKENSALGNNFIIALFEDGEGNLWIGTDGGAYIYNTTTDSFSPFFQQPSKKAGTPMLTHAVSCICQSPDGNIWLSYRTIKKKTDYLISYEKNSHAPLSCPYRIDGISSRHTPR